MAYKYSEPDKNEDIVYLEVIQTEDTSNNFHVNQLIKEGMTIGSITWCLSTSWRAFNTQLNIENKNKYYPRKHFIRIPKPNPEYIIEPIYKHSPYPQNEDIIILKVKEFIGYLNKEDITWCRAVDWDNSKGIQVEDGKFKYYSRKENFTEINRISNSSNRTIHRGNYVSSHPKSYDNVQFLQVINNFIICIPYPEDLTYFEFKPGDITWIRTSRTINTYVSSEKVAIEDNRYKYSIPLSYFKPIENPHKVTINNSRNIVSKRYDGMRGNNSLDFYNAVYPSIPDISNKVNWEHYKERILADFSNSEVIEESLQKAKERRETFTTEKARRFGKMYGMIGLIPANGITPIDSDEAYKLKEKYEDFYGNRGIPMSTIPSFKTNENVLLVDRINKKPKEIKVESTKNIIIPRIEIKRK